MILSDVEKSAQLHAIICVYRRPMGEDYAVSRIIGRAFAKRPTRRLARPTEAQYLRLISGADN